MFSNITNQFTSLVGAVKGGQGEEEMGATSQPESVTAPAVQEIVVAPEPIADAGAETDETKGGWLGSAKGWLGNASIPSMPAMPSMPSIPSMPAMPSMPTIPSIPGLRKVNNEEGSSEGVSNPMVAASATNVPLASGAGSSLGVEEDDKSKYISSTEGADPVATSGGGTPTNDEGQIGQVTTKVTQQAKHFGSFLTSAISKAGNKITETVKANPILESFNKEQEAFIKGQSGGNSQGMAPWVGHPNEIKIKEEIMGLSQDRRNFVRAPPAGVDFDFNYDTTYSTAVAIMAEDKALETMRFELVPKIITEENFWRNYFYRVSLIIQAAELGTLGEDGVTQASSGEDEEHWEKKLEAELRDCEAVEGACVSSTVIRTSIAQGYNNDSFNYSGDEMPTLSNIRARSTNNEWEEYADLIEDTDDLK